MASHPLAKILLPFDGSPSAAAAVRLAAALVQGCDAPVEQLTLLHVTGGSYLARHLQNVDLRTVRLEQTQEWQRLRDRRLEEEIKPLLAQGRALLEAGGVRAPIELQVADGKVGEQILAAARQGGFTSVFMGRRGLSPLKGLLLGSATQYILTRAQGLSVFIAGQGYGDSGTSPLFPLLLPVDGSAPSLAAVRQAALLARSWQPDPPRIELLHVADLALLGQMLGLEAKTLLDLGAEALAAAREILVEAGLQQAVEEKLLSGNPAQVIAREAESQSCAMIFMGSVGHSALGRLFLGSVTQSVLPLASRPAIGVVYPDTEPSS